MAVQLWPHRKKSAGDTAPGERVAGDAGPVATATDERAAGREAPKRGPATWLRSRRSGSDTVVVDRRRWQRMRRHRHNPISRLVWAAGWTAAVILVAGILLTWAGANPANALVGGILDIGAWLATPFHDLFRNSDADQRLYLNWGVAAAVYYVLGRVVSWLVRW